MIFHLIILPIIFIITFLTVKIVREYALKRQKLDIPNERSSHKIPTPSSGGIGIVLGFLIGIGYLLLFGKLDTEVFIVLAGGGLLVAVVGYIDDQRELSARIRIGSHIAAATWVILILEPIHSITIINLEIELGLIAYPFTILGITWLLNLYNFMDGIDGIAGSEAVFVASCSAFLLIISNYERMALALLVLAAASSGFLVWNWPPAKIFMGDVGSGFLGYIFAVFAVQTNNTKEMPLWSWFLLLSVFIIDATITLVRRIITKQKLSEAHRTHAYQHASIRLESHLKTTVSVVAINLLWLFPSAIVVWSFPKYGALISLLAGIPLILIVLHYNAGKTPTEFSLHHNNDTQVAVQTTISK